MRWSRRSRIPIRRSITVAHARPSSARSSAPSDSELAQVTAWLAAQGFTIDEIPPDAAWSSSPARRPGRAAFHTEMHIYRVDGIEHIANASDPQIPAAWPAGERRGLAARLPAHIGDRLAETVHVEVGILRGPQYSAGSTHYIFPRGFRHHLRSKPALQRGDNGAALRSRLPRAATST